MAFEKIQFSVILLGLEKTMRYMARKYPSFAKRLREKNLIVQIKIRDDSQGRYFVFRDGKVSSKSGIHSRPDVTVTYDSAELAARLMRRNRDQMEQINAMKNFRLGLEGPDELTSWFMETLSHMLSAGLEYGTDMGKGVTRYTSNTNGGPVFVDVKDGKIIRMTPIEFNEEDAPSWTIETKGRKFTPPRKTTVSPYTFAWKSMVYSPDRILYPMKRKDFDPKGERNCQEQGHLRL